MVQFSRVPAEDEAVFWSSAGASKGKIARRIEDCLMGGIIGDALGYPYSTMHREDVLPLLEPGRLRYRPHPSGGYDIGQWTDDTQMTMTTARAFVGCGAPDIGAVGNELSVFINAEPKNGLIFPGSACLQAIGKLAAGYGGDISGCSTGRAGCGALVRIAPVALWPWNSDKSMLEAVTAFGRLTHTDRRSCAACAAYATILRKCTYGAPGTTTDPQTLIEEARQAAGSFDTRAGAGGIQISRGSAVSDFLGEIAKYCINPGDEAAEWLTRGSFNFEGTKWVTPYVVTVLAASLLSWASSPGSPMNSFRTAISFGGVTDSVVSLTGQLHGCTLEGPGWESFLVEPLKDHAAVSELAASFGRMAVSGPVWTWTD